MSEFYCPVCGEIGEHRVTKTFSSETRKVIYRTRKCCECGKSFKTEERTAGIKRPKDRNCSTCIGDREECERTGGCMGYERA